MEPPYCIERVVLNETNTMEFLATQGYGTFSLVKCNDI